MSDYHNPLEYVPMAGPLPGVQYVPSNGTEGCGFLEDWCGRCARDLEVNGTRDSEDCGDGDWCPIIAASYRGEAVEWREHPDGRTECLAFVPFGQPLPPRKCEHTPDLFEGSAA